MTDRYLNPHPKPDNNAGAATFETQLVRWLKGQLAAANRAAQRSAAAHHTDAYARHDSARLVYGELLQILDPMGDHEGIEAVAQ